MDNNTFFLDIAHKILEIKSKNHEIIQYRIGEILKYFGFDVSKEYETFTNRRGFIDVVGKKPGCTLGVEIDGSIPRFKSIEKLNALNSTVSFLVLKSEIDENGYEEIFSRLQNLNTPYIVISLHYSVILSESGIAKTSKKRSFSVLELGESNDPSAIIQLIEFTKSKNANDRRLAASGLGKLSNVKPEIYEACPYLIKLLSDEKPQVRQYAATALGKIGCTKALPHLRKLLTDEKYYVRNAAKDAIKKCESK